MARTVLFTCLALALLPIGSARADGYAWDDSTCASGGTWFTPTCWAGGGYPNGIDDTAFVQLDVQGGVTIPTSSILNVTLNAAQFTENVAVTVGDNMILVMAKSSTGTDPTLLIDDVLTISSPDLGGSSLRAASPLDPEATAELQIYGSGEIRLGSNGAVESAPRARIVVGGGIEIVTSASVDKPARINAELTNNGGEIRVLGGPMTMMGDVENVGGGFVEIFDQFSTGLSEIRLLGVLRGGVLYPGLGVVRMNGGTLADIDVQPGPVEVVGPIAYFAGDVHLSEGTEVAILPTRTLEIGGNAVAGAPRLDNDGVIRVGHPDDGAGTLRNDGSLVELDGSGRIVLAHVGSQLASTGSGVFRNGPNHTIEGRGTILSAVQNEGLLVVDGGPMVLFESVTGPTGDTVVQGTASEPGRLDIRAGFVTRDLRIDEHGQLQVGGGRSVVVHRAWIVETTDETAIAWASGTQLVFAGAGPAQGFETTSADLGAVQAGFSGNFAIRRVVVGQSGTLVHLRDLHDNGNRGSGAEAVYANVLEVQPGATLNLNGYCFYTLLDGIPHRVQAGEGSLFGGGTIVDDTTLPTSVDDAPVSAGIGAVRVAPNPFNPRTTVRFEVGAPASGRVSIHDLRGRRLRDLASGSWTAGRHELTWDGRDDEGRLLASGVYAVRVQIGDRMEVRRVTLLK